MERGKENFKRRIVGCVDHCRPAATSAPAAEAGLRVLLLLRCARKFASEADIGGGATPLPAARELEKARSE